MSSRSSKRISFSAELTQDDCCTYREFSLDVPERCKEIRIHFSYSPYSVDDSRNLITLSLFDPLKFRGWVYPLEQGKELHISSQAASEGLVRKAIIPGEWKLCAAIPALISQEPCTLTLDLELIVGDASPSVGENFEFQGSLCDKPGWYRGELHSHTVHSDGDWSSEVLVEKAKERGLDFLALTDHNTISGWEDAIEAAHDEILIIPGLEITSFYGHAVVLGIEQWFDCRIGWEGVTMDEVARAVRRSGGYFIIAHPFSEGRPICAGCRWEYHDFDISLADGIEVWNSLWTGTIVDNEGSLRMWEEGRKGGHRLTATSGCDVHDEEAWASGTPYSYIWADALSSKALIQGLREGRVVNTTGPWLNITLAGDGEGRATIIGDTLVLGSDAQRIVIEYDGVPRESYLVFKQDYEEIARIPVSGSSHLEQEITAGNAGQITVELRTQTNSLLAHTNPVMVEANRGSGKGTDAHTTP